MPTLITKNIGPIKHVELEINKVNLFIGPQGSGKSTIAKLISFCTWAEKQIIFNSFTTTSESLTRELNERLKTSLIEFHNFDGFIGTDSSFSYSSYFVSIKYNRGSFKVTSSNEAKYLHKKIAYIPAERNIVATIPNWFEVKLPENNLRSFMSDWETARKAFTMENPLSIFGTAVQYRYEEHTKRDVLVLESKHNHLIDTIPLSCAASGFQSIIPLLAIFNHTTKTAYNGNKSNRVISAGAVTTRNAIIDMLAQDARTNDSLSDATLIAENITAPQTSFLVVEEPEQNLYPSTQRDLIYLMLAAIQSQAERNMALTITTHSPYILMALNNCVLGGHLKDKIGPEKMTSLPSHESWIDPALVSMWQITEGGVANKLQNENIQNPETGTVTKHLLNTEMNEVLNEYYALLEYL